MSVLAWTATITWLSSLPGTQLDRLLTFRFSDKAAHFGAFAVGAVLLTLALLVTCPWRRRTLGLVAVFSLALFGAVDEWHQLHTPKRSGGDPADWTADLLGAACGVAVTFLLHARSARTHQPAPAAD